jgi:very-short-patch-repair endonuclease
VILAKFTFMPINRTQLENRVLVLIAALSVALSLLDILTITPGWASKLIPFLIGIVILVRQRGQPGRHQFILRRTSQKQSRPNDKNTNPGRPETYREITWKGLTFRSHSELKVAKSLEHEGALFLSSAKVRLKTERGRQSREVDFLIFHAGQWGILEVDGPHHSAEADTWRDSRFQEHGIPVFRFDSKRCYQQPKQVVQEFLSRLESASLSTGQETQGN